MITIERCHCLHNISKEACQHKDFCKRIVELENHINQQNLQQLFDKSQKFIGTLQDKIKELEGNIKGSAGLQCPACDNVGWYVGHYGEQEQCEFCYTVPDSIFKRKEALKEKTR